MVLFKDLNKSATDLLTRDFPHNRPWDVQFKHTAKNPSFTQNAFINNAGEFEAQSSVKYTVPSGFLEAKLGTATSLLEAQYKVAYFPGLTLGTRFDRIFHAKGASEAAEFSLEWAKNGTHFNLAVLPFLPSFTASAVACIPANLGGGNGSGTSGTGRLGFELSGGSDIHRLKYSLGGSYSQTTKDLMYTASIRTAPVNGKPFGKVSSNIYAKAKRPNAPEYGVEVSHVIADSKTGVSFVGLWPLDPPSSGETPPNTFLKAKMSVDGQFVTSLTHKVNDFLTATLGAQMDSSKDFSSPNSIKYGMKLNILA